MLSSTTIDNLKNRSRGRLLCAVVVNSGSHKDAFSASCQGRRCGFFSHCSRLILCMNVHLGMIWIDSSQIIPKWTREYQSMFRKTRWLFVVRLVGKSKGPETEHLAFDKPQLRLRCPVREEPPSPSHDEGLD